MSRSKLMHGWSLLILVWLLAASFFAMEAGAARHSYTFTRRGIPRGEDSSRSRNLKGKSSIHSRANSKSSKSVHSRDNTHKSSSTRSGQLQVNHDDEDRENHSNNIFEHYPILSEVSSPSVSRSNSKSKGSSKSSSGKSGSISSANADSGTGPSASANSKSRPSHSGQHSPSFESPSSSEDYYYGKPDQDFKQPVLCGKAIPIRSALLVRMLGEPSLMTRYERIRVEQLVKESYNDWMTRVCDGYHRTILAVEMKPIEDTPTISQAHKQSLKAEESYIAQVDQEEGTDEAISEPIYNQLVQAEDLYESVGIQTNATTTSSPTPHTPHQIDLRYKPLYWLSLEATCRSCPRTELGNYNLLASHADSYRNASSSSTESTQRNASSVTTTAQRFETMTADNFIMEEVCYCPAPRGDKNVLNGTSTYDNIQKFFPNAVAPTSKQLMDSVNYRIQDLRANGMLPHIESLIQMTEPDYAYYALEITNQQESVQGFEDTIQSDQVDEVEDDSTIGTNDEQDGSATDETGEILQVSPSSAPSNRATPVPSLVPPQQDEGLVAEEPSREDSLAYSCIKRTFVMGILSSCGVIALTTLG